MENKELKEYKEILHEVKDPDRFEKFLTRLAPVGLSVPSAVRLGKYIPA